MIGFVEDAQGQTIGFSVENVVWFPPEVKKERWPENFSLSDHARTTHRGVFINKNEMFSVSTLINLSCKERQSSLGKALNSFPE
ncbi:hypothetical protein SLA2020_156160 [Shorea laevis]